MTGVEKRLASIIGMRLDCGSIDRLVESFRRVEVDLLDETRGVPHVGH